MMMLILWFKKFLGIKSPNTNNRGFAYAYDYYKALKSEEKFLELNPDKVTVSAQRLAELESLETPVKVDISLFEYKPLTIQRVIECEREYFETFDKAEYYKAYIAERLVKLMTPELIKRLDIVTDYNPCFKTYRTIGRLTILVKQEEA